MDVPVRALFMGERLVLEAASASWTSSQWEEPPIGLPVTEAWADEAWKPVRDLMLQVYRSGRPYSIIVPGAIVAVIPIWRQGRVAGVVTERVPVPPTPVHLEPSLELLAARRSA